MIIVVKIIIRQLDITIDEKDGVHDGVEYDDILERFFLDH